MRSTSTSTGGIVETKDLTPNETATFTADQSAIVKNNSLNNQENGDDHDSCSEIYAVQATSSASSKASLL